jgi:hypothetical protein
MHLWCIKKLPFVGHKAHHVNRLLGCEVNLEIRGSTYILSLKNPIMLADS